MEKELIFMEPVLKECVWGGKRLVEEYPYQLDSQNVGECWAVSAHKNGDCVISSGKYKGTKLSELYKSHRELFGNLKAEEFPLLVKMIDAKKDLSIQVHPGDEYARKVEHVPFGKSEMWYVLDAAENAQLILGHTASTREELERLIREDHYEELICRIPVKKGDVIPIPPGTIHAICGGVLILEIQQNCDITYRVYDYHRLVDGKPRALHVEQSIEVINVPDRISKDKVVSFYETKINELVSMAECDYYKIWKIQVKNQFSISMKEKFMTISVLEGEGTISGIKVSKGSHLIVPYEYGDIEFTGDMMLVASSPKE